MVGKSIEKLDSRALLSGKAMYTDDFAPINCPVIKLLRSPHAFARIKAIDVSRAQAAPGVLAVFTYRDTPAIRFQMGGTSFPERSPYDRLILDEYVRYVGDVAAIVLGEDERSADNALKLIKIQYEVLEPVLDFTKALDAETVVHPQKDYFPNGNPGSDPARNLVMHQEQEQGDLKAVLDDCDVVEERTFITVANSHVPMEGYRSYCYLDHNQRLVIISSTQIPFHVRRIVAQALGIPDARVRVIKPRIGGGFGAKQSLITEIINAFVTEKTGLPSKLVFTRNECFIGSNSRHQMRFHVKMGATKDGIVRALEVDALSNAGAFSEHAGSTAMLSVTRNIPLFSRLEAYRYSVDAVYTNTMTGGAFRGYGVPQGCFALQSMASTIAQRLQMDPVAFYMKNIPHEGMQLPAFGSDAPLGSCALDRCIQTGKQLIGWRADRLVEEVGEDRVMAYGMAVSMQTSGIAELDASHVSVRLNDKGYYTLTAGACDIGTGCDTILAQIVCEELKCDLQNVVVSTVDTDYSPFDKGACASRTTYLSGMAAKRACEKLREQILEQGAMRLDIAKEEAGFDGEYVYALGDGAHKISLNDLAIALVKGSKSRWLTATEGYGSKASPPPFVAGFCKILLDRGTGAVRVLDFVLAVDCGTVMNPTLARVQAEGGIVQGIGMALYEDVRYNANGKLTCDSLLNYRIPTRLDIPRIQVAFESSYESTGPYGAKSIGEVVINAPAPAIADAVYRACGVRICDLPITPEKVKMALLQQAEEQRYTGE